MPIQKVIIEGCSNCPFAISNDMSSGYSCTLQMHFNKEERRIKENKRYQAVTPKWCPLKTNYYLFGFKK